MILNTLIFHKNVVFFNIIYSSCISHNDECYNAVSAGCIRSRYVVITPIKKNSNIIKTPLAIVMCNITF